MGKISDMIFDQNFFQPPEEIFLYSELLLVNGCRNSDETWQIVDQRVGENEVQNMSYTI